MFYNVQSVGNKKLSVRSMGEHAIFVGDKNQAEDFQKINITPEMREKLADHQRDLKAIDEAWDNIGVGNSHFNNGDYEGAAEAYKKAYLIGGGIKHVSGFNLAKTYEKLGRYDDAIAVLDGMIKNRETNAYGIQKANELKARLLTAQHPGKETVPGEGTG